MDDSLFVFLIVSLVSIAPSLLSPAYLFFFFESGHYVDIAVFRSFVFAQMSNFLSPSSKCCTHSSLAKYFSCEKSRGSRWAVSFIFVRKLSFLHCSKLRSPI